MALHKLFGDIDMWAGLATRKGMKFAVVLEDPNEDSNVFRTSTLPTGIKEYRQQLRMAQDVGKNKGVANAISNYMMEMGYETLLVAPSDRQRVTNREMKLSAYRMPTKCTAEQFREATGWGRETNEHNRDAACLLLGMTGPKFRLLHAISGGTKKKVAGKNRKSRK